MSLKQYSTSDKAPPPDAVKLHEVEDNFSEIASSKSVEKKKFTVIEPAVFLIYIATALSGKAS